MSRGLECILFKAEVQDSQTIVIQSLHWDDIFQFPKDLHTALGPFLQGDPLRPLSWGFSLCPTPVKLALEVTSPSFPSPLTFFQSGAVSTCQPAVFHSTL